MKMKWKIEHIELFFYNGCDNRWQMFQENPNETEDSSLTRPESFFRVQLEKLLQTVRDALIKKRGDIEVGDKALGPFEDTEVKMRRSADKRLRKAFAKFCVESLDKEGIHDEGLEKALAQLRTKDYFTLPKDSVSNLLSILPMARDWDVFGWLHPMSTSSTRFKPEDFWWRFFVYRVAFQKKADGVQPSAEQPLEEDDVFLQLLGSGKKEDDDEKLELDPTTEVPYFKFAKSPLEDRREKGQPIMSPAERKLYEAYGAVIDSIQKKRAVTEQEGGCAQKNSFYVVYPVIACGYYHFFQLRVTPINGTGISPSDLITNCNFTFGSVLSVGKYEYQVLKESLRELLVQIRLSAFQHYVTQWITRHRSRLLAASSPDLLAVECFCELAPLINEMRAIATRSSVWAHVGSDSTSAENDIQRVLKPWSKINEKRHKTWVTRKNGRAVEIKLNKAPKPLRQEDYRIVPISEASIDLWLFHKQKDDEKFAEECFAGTNGRRLEEQYIAVKERVRRFWYAGRP